MVVMRKDVYELLGRREDWFWSTTQVLAFSIPIHQPTVASGSPELGWRVLESSLTQSTLEASGCEEADGAGAVKPGELKPLLRIPVDPPWCRQPAEGTLDLSWGT